MNPDLSGKIVELSRGLVLVRWMLNVLGATFGRAYTVERDALKAAAEQALAEPGLDASFEKALQEVAFADSPDDEAYALERLTRSHDSQPWMPSAQDRLDFLERAAVRTMNTGARESGQALVDASAYLTAITNLAATLYSTEPGARLPPTLRRLYDLLDYGGAPLVLPPTVFDKSR